MSLAPSSVSTYSVAGIPISSLRLRQAAHAIVDLAERGQVAEIHLCNAYTIALAGSDDRLRDALLRADLNLPDGSPVAWLGRKTGTRGPVRGPSLVGEVARAGGGRISHYLYGGHDGVAELMADGLRAVTPDLVVVGTEAPPYRDLDDVELQALAERIMARGASVLWIGLGTPRQDYLVARLAPLVGIPTVPIGAAFDFWSGNVPEAPKWVHGTGLEWIYRLIREPRRLWRRYLFGNMTFVRAVATDMLRRAWR